MSGDGLTSDALKQQYAAVISDRSTFKPQGVSEQVALEYLKTDEGAMYYWRVAEAAEPGLRPDQIQDRAIGQIRSGLELPRMETIEPGERLLKFVAEGVDPSAHSPYWIRESQANAAFEAGKGISEFYGLPIGSEASRYDVYRITPQIPTQMFINTVAPTSELDGLVTKGAGAEQALVPNRHLFSDPVHIRTIDNTLALAEEAERGFLRGVAPGLAVAGAATLLYDASRTAGDAIHLRGEGNRAGAESEIMHFGGRNLGALGGAILGAEVVGAAGIEFGPLDIVAAGIGGIAGGIGGAKLADAHDRHQIYNQADSHGVSWSYDPAKPQQGWTREIVTGEIGYSPSHPTLGYGVMPGPVMRTIRADPVLADRLTFQANNTAVDLALAHPPEPRDPYTQPAGPHDTASRVAASWKRDAQTQQWSRLITDRVLEHGIAATHVERAGAPRAAQLDDAAKQTIEANIDNSRRGIAQHYQAVYERHGWAQYGAMPEAVANALHPSPDTLQASDGHTYTRDRDGQWNTPGMIWGSNAADGNLRRELDATRCAEQAAADHGHAAMPTLTLRAFSDPDHPQHALFNTLRSAFPQGTSNERLHQATAACYTAGIRQPQHLSGIMGNDSAIHFRSTILGAPPGQMDMTKPAPAVPQTLQQVQTHDQQHAQMMSQVHAQNPQFNQPASQLPMPGGR